VGALGYFLLTGANVFEADSVFDLYEKHLTATAVAPSQRGTNPVSAQLDKTILQCLEKNPDLRPQSVGALRELLLASPFASAWGLQAREQWWNNSEGQMALEGRQIPSTTGSPLEATVKIDLASRIN
jgi:hypothetical protein